MNTAAIAAANMAKKKTYEGTMKHKKNPFEERMLSGVVEVQCTIIILF